VYELSLLRLAFSIPTRAGKIPSLPYKQNAKPQVLSFVMAGNSPLEEVSD
jgi:hypothetical protein